MREFRRRTSSIIAIGLGVAFAAMAAGAAAQSTQPRNGIALPGTPIEPAGRAVVNVAALAEQAALEPARTNGPPRSIHSPLSRPDVVDPSLGLTPRTWTPPRGPRQPSLPSPSPSVNFAALDDSGVVIPPDAHGAAGPTRLMTTTTDSYRVQDRSGTALSTLPIDTFWAATGATGVFDPRVLYDPYTDRWIVAAVSGAATASSSVLVGVSQTGDPAGTFHLFRFDVDAANTTWADFPTLGFNKNWIVVTVNMFTTGTFSFSGGHVYAMDYPSARSGVSHMTQVTGGGATMQPALTYSAAENTLYMVEHVSSGSATYRHYTVTGTPGLPEVTQFSSKVNLLGGWATPSGDILPQSGTTTGINAGDARVANVVFRNGAIWYTQTIGLPIGPTPQRTAVQWVQLDTLGTFAQGGRIDDPTATSTNGGFWYAYPSIAVNTNSDVLIGFSRFSSATFASAGYAFRAAGDTAGTQRDAVVYRTGDATYVKTFGGSRNRWGDYSMTCVDPVDDTSFWTIQEYARPAVGAGASSSRWGTWWARVVAASAGNTPPTIADIANQITPEDIAAGPVAFTIGDTETVAAALTLSATSSDTLLVPNAGITFGGSGANRTISAAPAANLSGVTTITVTVADGSGATAQDTFTVTVTAVNDPPTLGPIADPPPIVEDVGLQVVYLSGIGAGGESQPLQVTAASSNTTVVPDPAVTYSSPNSTGSLTYTPVGNRSGTATITVTVMDGGLDGNLATPGDNDAVSRTFTVTVIGANDPPTISPIADQIVAEDAIIGPLAFTVGDIEDAAGTLVATGASSNQAVVLDANVMFGGSGANRTVTVTPTANQTGIASMTVTVTDAGGATAEDTFLVTVGSLEDNPTITDIANRSTPEDTATGPIAFTVGDVETPAASLVVTAGSSNLSLVPESGLALGGAGAARTITVTPGADQTGIATITLTVTDEMGKTAQDTFFLTVTAVNDAPTIGDIPNQTTGLNTVAGPVAFAVDDIDHAAGTLTLTATSSNPTLVPIANVTFGGAGVGRTVTVAPATNLSGSSVISVTVTDPAGGAAQDSFLVTVTDPGTTAPTISDIGDVIVPEDTVAGPLTFTVGDAETPAAALVLSGGSSRTSLVANANIVFGGAGANRTVTVTPAPDTSGTTTVSVVVTDANGATAYDTFTVTVTPVNDAPVISAIPDRTIPKDSGTAAAFTVSDVETPAQNLTLAGASSNVALVPGANILFGGSGANRTVTVTPVAGQTGAAVITITVGDGGLQTGTQFLLTVAEPGPVGLTITRPTTSPLTAATSPFLAIGGTATSSAPITGITWATDRGFSGSGTLTATTAADAAQDTRSWRADVPLVAGSNFITLTAIDGLAQAGTDTLTVTVGSFVYSMAEGATGPFFDLDLAITNPNDAFAPVSIQYLEENGSTSTQGFTMSPRSRTTVRVDGLAGLSSAAVSSVLTSPSALPLAVERTMTWDKTGYGAHTERATPGAHTTWYFAEGSEQGFFDTYLLLANPQGAANRATVRFLVEGGGPVTKVYDLLPSSRMTVFAENVADGTGTKVLAGKAFGITVTFDLPGVAERAMYFGSSPLWTGGHESAGVNEPSLGWFHAEGAVGDFFDTFLLLSNPNAADAVATLTFLRDTGETKATTRLVPADSRVTVFVDGEFPGVASAGVATQVTATLPIVSERAMYWAAYPNWYEAHGSFGVTSLATRWALGEGRVGGPDAHETYILLANPGTTATSVTVTFLREGGLQPLARTYTIPATSRFNVYANAADIGLVSGERFGAVIESTDPIAVERAMYSTSISQPGVVWAAGTNAAGTPIP